MDRSRSSLQVRPFAAVVLTLFIASFAPAAHAGSVDFSPTQVGNGIRGCVSDAAVCPQGGELLDDEDDTITLFDLEEDVGGFEVLVDLSASDTGGMADVFLNDEMVGTLKDEMGMQTLSATFAGLTETPVIRFENTGTGALVYGFGITAIPEPGTAALLGLGLTGLAASGRSRAVERAAAGRRLTLSISE